MTKNNNKQYFFRIYHEKIGYGGHKEKLFKNFDYLLCDTKKKAFERAKYELFNLAKIDYEHLFCIKKEFEDFYLELLKNDNYEELDNLLNNLDVFDFNKLGYRFIVKVGHLFSVVLIQNQLPGFHNFP